MRRAFLGSAHAAVAAAVAAVALAAAPVGADPPAKQPPAWCAPDIEALADDVCWFEGPAPDGQRTLILFLHGLIKPDSTWQWTQQRAMMRQAKRFGFSVLAPRGRRGVGPGGMASVAWPSAANVDGVEPALLGEWARARKTIETRRGKPFPETFVLGYSNGGYYASSLAVRDKLDVDGYVLVAGASATADTRAAAKAAKRRIPIFVAVAMGDKTSSADSRGFAAVLEAVAWPHKVHASSASHEVADRQVERALEYLRDTTKHRTATPP